MKRILLVAVAVTGFVLAPGCKHRCCRKDPCSSARPAPVSGSPFLLPPAGVPTTPAPMPTPAGPPVGPEDLRNYSPPRPAPEVLLPEPIPGTGSSQKVAPAPGFLGGPVNPTAEPPVTSGTGPTAGLPSYVRVMDGVASGRKPTLDGFDTLKQARYRTVVYLHAPSADVSAMREVASKRGLTFVAIETTPEKLPAATAQFSATVADAGRHPLYVFDDDGVRAGAVWYLYFRTAESMNDDAARIRARPLGLTEQGEEARAFAIATQKYLESR